MAIVVSFSRAAKVITGILAGFLLLRLIDSWIKSSARFEEVAVLRGHGRAYAQSVRTLGDFAVSLVPSGSLLWIFIVLSARCQGARPCRRR